MLLRPYPTASSVDRKANLDNTVVKIGYATVRCMPPPLRQFSGSDRGAHARANVSDRGATVADHRWQSSCQADAARAAP
jgi:hypothetical protein